MVVACLLQPFLFSFPSISFPFFRLLGAGSSRLARNAFDFFFHPAFDAPRHSSSSILATSFSFPSLSILVSLCVLPCLQISRHSFPILKQSFSNSKTKTTTKTQQKQNPIYVVSLVACAFNVPPQSSLRLRVPLCILFSPNQSFDDLRSIPLFLFSRPRKLPFHVSFFSRHASQPPPSLGRILQLPRLWLSLSSKTQEKQKLFPCLCLGSVRVPNSVDPCVFPSLFSLV